METSQTTEHIPMSQEERDKIFAEILERLKEPEPNGGPSYHPYMMAFSLVTGFVSLLALASMIILIIPNAVGPHGNRLVEDIIAVVLGASAILIAQGFRGWLTPRGAK